MDKKEKCKRKREDVYFDLGNLPFSK